MWSEDRRLVEKVLRLGAEAECCRYKWQPLELLGLRCCSSDVFCVLLEFVVRKSVTLEFSVQPVCHPNASAAEPAGNGLTIHHYLFLLLIMATLCNRAGHYIFALWFLLLLLSFFPRLSANLRCRSETCCMRLPGNTGRKKVTKNRHLHHRTTFSGYIFATKARIDNWKKNLLSSNMSSRCPHNTVNFGPLAAEIG